MSENKKVLFIINKFSGSGFQPSLEGRIIDACAKAQLECSIKYTQAPGHATELAKQGISQQYQSVFAVGGDGTVNEVAKGLVGTSVAMGILPNGSGNGLARHLNIPMDLKKSIMLINSTNSILMDTILVNGKLSVNMSGVGFDGHIAGMFGKNGKRGLISYSKIALNEFARFNEFEAAIDIDGKRIESKYFIIAFANSSQPGNNARIAPGASVCDQLIDVCLIRKMPLQQILPFSYNMFSGNLINSKLISTVKANQISIWCKVPIPFHIDGEAYPPTHRIEVTIQPATLRILLTADHLNPHIKKYSV
jgi:diacylglycerol kinase (ATP)